MSAQPPRDDGRVCATTLEAITAERAYLRHTGVLPAVPGPAQR